MFDGICPNDRIFGSRFEQGRTSMTRTAPGAEDAKQRMEICTASFVLKNDMYSTNESERGNGVEHSAKNILAQYSKWWPSAQDFRSKHHDVAVRDEDENGVESSRAARRDRWMMVSRNPSSKLILVRSEEKSVAPCDAGEHVKELVWAASGRFPDSRQRPAHLGRLCCKTF